MVFNLQVSAYIIGLIWLSILTFFWWRLYSHYTNLVRDDDGRTLKTILDTLLIEIQASKSDVEILKKLYGKIEKDGNSHIQKIGLLRFNPFKDTGGEQSFIVSFLDETESGVVISGLYSRSGTRWYAKRIKQGKGIDHDLSEEEKKAIHEAK